MKTTEDIKMYHFFDEAGDPQILGRGGINLVTEGKSSKVFSVGYLEVKDPKEVRKGLIQLQQEIINDEYLKDIPSISKSTKVQFHACMDCPEVREKVYRFLKNRILNFNVLLQEKILNCSVKNLI